MNYYVDFQIRGSMSAKILLRFFVSQLAGALPVPILACLLFTHTLALLELVVLLSVGRNCFYSTYPAGIFYLKQFTVIFGQKHANSCVQNHSPLGNRILQDLSGFYIHYIPVHTNICICICKCSSVFVSNSQYSFCLVVVEGAQKWLCLPWNAFDVYFHSRKCAEASQQSARQAGKSRDKRKLFILVCVPLQVHGNTFIHRYI